MVYWICTVSPGGYPHATPVDGLWLDGRMKMYEIEMNKLQRVLI
jgi:hypothetical protein